MQRQNIMTYTPPCMIQNRNMMPLQYQTSNNPQSMAGLEEYTYPQNVPGALELIREAVAGETEDRLFYQYLIDNAPSEEDKEIIMGIRDDEIRHFNLFGQVYYQLTGQMPPFEVQSHHKLDKPFLVLFSISIQYSQSYFHYEKVQKSSWILMNLYH